MHEVPPSAHSVSEHLRAASEAAERCATEGSAFGDAALARHYRITASELRVVGLVHAVGARFLGVPMPAPRTTHQGAVHFPAADVPEPLWEVVHALGVVFQREIGYASNPFRGHPSQDGYGASLWVADGRAAGLLLYEAEVERFYWLDEVAASALGKATPLHDGPRFCIIGVWVAEDFRRQGIAHGLAAAAAKANFRDVSDFIHSPPFTEGGIAFARSLAGGLVRVNSNEALSLREAQTGERERLPQA